MPPLSLRRPMLPSSYHVLFEPPDAEGEEALVFISSARRIRVKGRFFREFHQVVVPLLDGTKSLDEIATAAAENFASEDLTAAIVLLADNGILVDAADLDTLGEDASRLEPQLNLFAAVTGAAVPVQRKLAASTVAVVGLGNAGSSVAAALAGSGIGQIRGVDNALVGPADPYLSPFYQHDDVGTPRALALAGVLLKIRTTAHYDGFTETLADDAAVRDVLTGCDFVVNCLDQGEISLAYKINRICLELGTRWISGSASGLEVKVGPLVVPNDTACFMCYQMRLVACSERPEEALRFQTYLDHRKRDDSARHENLACGPTVCAQLMALETIKELSGVLTPALRGRLFAMNLADLSTSMHQVLRKPWCPACGATSRPSANEAAHVSD